MIEVIHEYSATYDKHEIVVIDADDTDILVVDFSARDCKEGQLDGPHEAHDDILRVVQLLQSIYDPAYKGPLLVFLAKE